jgi:hypothetical protein
MHYPEATITKLKQLTAEIIKDQLFGNAYGHNMFNDFHVNAILNRRDQILAHYEKISGK